MQGFELESLEIYLEEKYLTLKQIQIFSRKVFQILQTKKLSFERLYNVMVLLKIKNVVTFPVVQWLRICLPVQGTWV